MKKVRVHAFNEKESESQWIFTAFMYRQLHKYNKDKMLQHKSEELKAHLLIQIILKLNVRQGSYSHYSHIGLEQHFKT